ncbi:MAG TPA: biotin/lipoyl-binding protein, partial [Blastocatellia bacterium]|nr:biotin/lipoyl-binding protein [Blastocatellia bacterium]
MKIKLGNKKTLLGAAITLIALAVVGFTYFGRKADAEEYLTAKIERGNIRNTVTATGALKAVTTVLVGSQASGRISALYVDFNSTVKKGQVIAQLDPAVAQAQVAQARANLEQAKAALADAQAKVIAAKSTVQNQRAGVSSANANLAALKAARDDAYSLVQRQEALAASGVIPQ